jgi:16S rRNA (cytosine1402-N4)-methyltransferase
MTAGSFHTPVMLREVIDVLVYRQDAVYVDGTVGGAGHASGILEHAGAGSILIGIDCDDEALVESRRRLERFGARAKLVKGSYADVAEILREFNITEADGLFLDLGVSSHQFDETDRGFSIYGDAPLDMRMNRSGSMTAYDIVNGFSEERLRQIIRNFGEEFRAGKIARTIAAQRTRAPIRTTGELAALIMSVMPSARRGRHIHPATKTFQALRIAVNDELSSLIACIEHGVDILRRGGRVAVISFHSLEDRIVKNLFRSFEKGCICPDDFPVCVCGKKPQLRVLTRKPSVPQPEEVAANPRARSARLRAAEKV